MPTFSITPEQQKAIEALTWLNSNEHSDQRTGRTYALALYYLRQLVLHPENLVIRVYDHYESRDANFVLARIIQDLGRQIGCTITYGSVPGNRFCTEEMRVVGRVTRAMEDAVTNFEVNHIQKVSPNITLKTPSNPIRIAIQQRSLWDFVKED